MVLSRACWRCRMRLRHCMPSCRSGSGSFGSARPCSSIRWPPDESTLSRVRPHPPIRIIASCVHRHRHVQGIEHGWLGNALSRTTAARYPNCVDWSLSWKRLSCSITEAVGKGSPSGTRRMASRRCGTILRGVNAGERVCSDLVQRRQSRRSSNPLPRRRG